MIFNKQFFILFFASVCSLTFAHDNKNHKNNSREWNLVDNSRTISASLLMLKEGNVYLEKSNGEIQKYSLVSLSDNDKEYVRQKNEYINKLNKLEVLLNNQELKNSDRAFFMDSAFSPFKPNVATSWDDNYFYVESLGMAEHKMMAGIISWQQQVPIPQCYVGDNAWSIPLNPEMASTPLSLQNALMRGAVAIATNGIPIFNPLNNRGEDAYLVGELDDFGGHSGRADDYHYHTGPLHLEDKTSDILAIAFALDGFPIYGSKEPDGSDMLTLDQYNGHTGSNGIYHYHAVETYPYIMSSMVGEVTTDSDDAESQIIPQARTTPIRPYLQPLQGASITDFEQIDDSSYSLAYSLSGQNYTVNYNWTSTGEHTYEFIESDGSSSSESYQGFVPCEVPSEVPSTRSISQGLASAITSNLLDCENGRVAEIGTITAMDNTVWTVPAEVNFQDADFPFASDLHNPCNGENYSTTAEALSQLDGSDIVEVDTNGEIITAYIFADNYFEMYINGKKVGKDKVPFTQFNSSIVRFRVVKPFTIAVKLVDWEENLGLGSENNRGFSYHPGDGGFVATFYNEEGNNIAFTNNTWKAQTYYIAPIRDTNCVIESGNERLTTNCNTDGSNDGGNFYAIHYPTPSGWYNENYDDSSWPSAYTFTNATVGIDNKMAYTNFTDVFDNPDNDAEFIWSSNLILDNLVLVRYTVEDGATSVLDDEETEDQPTSYKLEQNYPNPFNPSTQIKIRIPKGGVYTLRVYDVLGREVKTLLIGQINAGIHTFNFDASNITSGIYYYNFSGNNFSQTKKMLLMK